MDGVLVKPVQGYRNLDTWTLRHPPDFGFLLETIFHIYYWGRISGGRQKQKSLPYLKLSSEFPASVESNLLFMVIKIFYNLTLPSYVLSPPLWLYLLLQSLWSSFSPGGWFLPLCICCLGMLYPRIMLGWLLLGIQISAQMLPALSRNFRAPLPGFHSWLYCVLAV